LKPPCETAKQFNLSMNRKAKNDIANYEKTMLVKFYMDSGATQHMCNDLFVMRNCNPTNTDILTGCKHGIVKGTSVGTVLLHSNKQYRQRNLRFYETQFLRLNSGTILFL